MFSSQDANLAVIPDDLTVPQFIFDRSHPLKPNRPEGVPCLVVDKTERKLSLEEVQARTTAFALVLREKYCFGENDVLTVVSPNHVDCLTCLWATHRLLGIFAPCNPALTSSEIVEHLRLSKTSHIVVHQDVLDTVIPASRQMSIPQDHIITLTDQETPTLKSKDASYLKLPSVEELIEEGKKLMSLGLSLPEIKLARGEAKTRIALYSSSSGTTGPPKMVKLSHYAIIATVVLTATFHKVNDASEPREKLKYRPGDSCLAIPPFYHIYGVTLLSSFNVFASIVVVVVPKYNFYDMLKSIERHHINSLMLVPPQAVLLCKDPAVRSYDLSSVRTILCGAAPLSGELFDQLSKLLPRSSIIQAYGSTEGGMVSMTPTTQKPRRSVGVIMPGIQYRVVKADGTLAAHNEPGELHIKSPAVASGYLDNDAATKETFLEGWLRTGDQVVFDENGELVVLDRIKEMIKVRGFQVAPAELEGCILEHPYARDACVVGIPDLYSGELPFAFVVLTERGQAALKGEGKQSVEAAIQKHVEKNKARFKRLHGVEIIDAIPKTPSGKLLRRVLRDRASESFGVRDAKL